MRDSSQRRWLALWRMTPEVVQSIVVCSSDLSEDMVYDLTKAIWDNQETLSGMLSALSTLDVDNALDGVTTDFHPGAVKYYKEIGMM